MHTQPELHFLTPRHAQTKGQPRRVSGEAAIRETFERGIAARLQRLDVVQSNSITQIVIDIAGPEIDRENGVDLETAARIVNRILRQEILKASSSPDRPDQWISSRVSKAVRKLRNLAPDQREALVRFYLDGVSGDNILGMRPDEFRKLKESLRNEVAPRRKPPGSSAVSRVRGNSRKAS